MGLNYRINAYIYSNLEQPYSPSYAIYEFIDEIAFL